MTTGDVGRPRNGNIQYAIPARPDALPCSRHQIAYDVARVLGVSRLGSITADGIEVSKQLGSRDLGGGRLPL
jgi:hypothetical protein